MKISDMVALVNKFVGSGGHSYDNLSAYFDSCIDTINEDLNIHLPLISAVYSYDSGGAFDRTEDEFENHTFVNNNVDNEYTRIPDAYIRNYICHQVAYDILSEEDEAEEVTRLKAMHAAKWYTKLISKFNNYVLEDTEVPIFNGDVDENEGVEDIDVTNPYFLGDGE